MRYHRFLPLSLVFLALVAGCATPAPPPVREDWTRSAIPLDAPLKANTRAVAYGKAWRKQTEAAYSEAQRYITHEAVRHEAGQWAVVLDIDQTVLNNIDYQKVLDRKEAPFSPGSWRDWVEQRRATPIPGAFGFIHTVNALGGHVVFVTNRRDYEAVATVDNLAALGLIEGRDYALLLPRAWPDGVEDKQARFAAVPGMLAQEGYRQVRLVAFLGDVASDAPKGIEGAAFFCVPQGGLYGEPCEGQH